MSRLALSFALTLAACSTTAPAPQASPAVTTEMVDALCAALRAMGDDTLDRPAAPAFEPAPAIDTIELNQRLADLTEQLRRLEARLPGGSNTAAADASARGAHDEHHETQVLELQRALSRLDQARTILTENVANAHTHGYLRRTWEEDDADPLRVRVTQVPGALYLTDRSLDVAIDGDGYFGVRLADQSAAYTRNGNWAINAEGKLVDNDGNLVLPGTTLPADTLEVSIDPLGKVTGRTASNPDAITTFGEIFLYRFPAGTELRPLTATLVLPCTVDATPVPAVPGTAGTGTVKQGFLQGSNVSLRNEIENLRKLAADRLQIRRALAALGVFVD